MDKRPERVQEEFNSFLMMNSRLRKFFINY